MLHTLPLPRREFLSGAAKGAAVLSAASYSRVLGANDKIILGVIGCGDRGKYDMELFQQTPEVEVAALCDIYGARMEEARQHAPQARMFQDYRKLLDLPELNAVLIATPDHWHAQCAIDALNAGKDVYVEKPLTLTIEEGPRIVKAARLNGRVCQAGMQQRSGKHYLEAKREFVDSGRLGKVTLVRTWWHGNGYHLRRAPAYLEHKPADLDWAAFLGPLKWRDWDPQQYFNWRAYLDFGGGQVTDLFTHWVDVAHMFLGVDIPSAAVASGGVFAYKDGRTAPDTICVLLQYPAEFTVTFEATVVPSIFGAGVEFCGTKGRLVIDREHYEFIEVGARQPVELVVGRKNDITAAHIANFLDCMRTRKLPNGDVLAGHRSAQASHLGNIAYMQKRRIDFDPLREAIQPF
jgi:predicted dehydrogenase